jgi:hypothetical protein
MVALNLQLHSLATCSSHYSELYIALIPRNPADRLLWVLTDIYDKEVEVLVTQLQERIESLSGT